MGRFSSSSMFYQSENDAVFYNHNNEPYSSSYAPVDCTLSLATPSTRLISAEEDHHHRGFSSSTTSDNVPGLGLGFLGGGNCKTASYVSHQSRTGIPRRCSNCDTTSTPLWRNGPRGPKSLCNACGIRFKKEERRAAAGKAISGVVSSDAEGVPTSDHQIYVGGTYYDYSNQYYDSSATWHNQTPPLPQRAPCSYHSPAAKEYTFIDDVRDGGSDVTAGSFLSWRLNVADQLYYT